MDTNEDAKPRTRRRHDRDLKRQVLAACALPGASVATVAMAHGLNANLVHKWRRLAGAGTQPARPAFVPLTLAAAAPVAEGPLAPVELELQRGALTVRVRWPMASAAASAAWLREVLR